MQRVDPDELLLMGYVARAHGVRGAFKVVPETDDPRRFEALETIYVGRSPESVRPVRLRRVQYQPTRRGLIVLLQVEEITDRDAAQALRGLRVYARQSDLPPLAEGEFFLHDLVGLRVETEAGELVGTVVEVLEMPAHLIYVVGRPGRPHAMVPDVDVFVRELDLEGRRLVIRPIEGLLD
ncbi:ribosome maturation factor RimM [Rhodothermus profundi]|uniref:Ribosome maturation factor RimM n=1 Tax=Rhodothermus profundi TaxID=633813 RepID=A0A1M6PMV4_9BACT|nr:ribosome maturation factor RimM [Rhodothermus profundi]SHK09289.1 16S rRNA processing protein RimM [Rhodothermus profundi]